MADIFFYGIYYQGTYQVGTVEVDPIYQICASGTINASNQWLCSFWIHENGERVDSNLGTAAYRFRDSTGALVSGISQTGITPDVNGYYHVTPVSAANIYDLSHYMMEIDISVDGVLKTASIPVVMGA